jgi:hypothetical protein
MNTETLLQLLWDGENGDAGTAMILADFLEGNGHGDLSADLRTDARQGLSFLSGDPGVISYHGGTANRTRITHEKPRKLGVLPGENDRGHRRSMYFRMEVARRARQDDYGNVLSRRGPTPAERAIACRKAWADVLLVSCYRYRPTPPAVRVDFPKSPYPLYAEANGRAARDLALWLTHAFPGYTRVHHGEPADRSVLQNLDWVVL